MSAKHEENTEKAQEILYKLYYNTLGRVDSYEKTFNRDFLTEKPGVQSNDL